MTNRVVATYQGDGESHSISFTPPTPGSRLILVVTAWFSVDEAGDASGPWVEDASVIALTGGSIYSKVAVGDETSVSFSHEDGPTHAVLYERDDCGQRVFSRSVMSSQSSLQTTSVNVPALAYGQVFAVVAASGDSVAGVTWTQGLVQHHTASGDGLQSGFAFGPMPAPGSRTWRVSDVPDGLDDAVLIVVGYGTVDGTAPTVPGSVRATNIEDDQITVEWDASTDDHLLAGYGLYKNGVKQGGDQVGTVFTFAGLTMGQTYTFGVDSVDGAGNRSAKAEIVVTAVLDVDPPTVPGDLRVVEVTHNSASVAWDESTDNVGVAGYGVYVSGVKQGPDLAGLEHVVTRLARATSYTIEVDAVDARGNRSERAEVEAETLAGADPGEAPGVTATPGREQITLAWGEAEAGASPIARYEILLDGVVVAVTEALSFVLEELEAGGTYEVGVRPVDEEAVRGPVVSVVVEVPAADWLPVASPVYRLGGWAGNARDVHGVTWVVEDEDGWSSSALPETLSADADAGDGGFAGPGTYGPRIVTLSGTAIAPGRTAMLAAQERLTGVLSAAGVGVLHVEEAHLSRQAQVRLEDQVEVTDRGSYAFEWVLTLRAADPRRYKRRGVHAEIVFEPAQTFGHATVVMDGDYPAIPARLRLVGPIKNPVIGIDELGLEIRSRPDTVLPDSRYEMTFDLGTRAVWAIVPPEVWPEPRPGRRALEVFPARFALGPGPNTIRLSGELVEGQELSPRLVVEARDAWI